ncbi:MAG: PEP-CTERM system histidine kinase PrsK [Natronospirillum sp.]|uniref:XrtA/PEP-CTERM system histidine kinase PrsK n=1 Tax=Natronospirillum sp. TaxID=2812955 RepID=UPI0025EFF3D6|nr:XrtA/PEP-CTERM system histidine kinase PrsK [Natronospirillum sp.]MCH8551551.1 PEP-CTERM system histidine kinase PrsK [Natronospirillum sp.]
MAYNDVTLIAYSSAGALSLIFTLFLFYAAVAERWKWPIAVAAAVQTAWLVTLSASLANQQVSNDSILAMEAAHFLTWILGLNLALRLLRPEQWPIHLKISLLIGVLAYAVALVDIFISPFDTTTVYFFCFLVLSLVALVSLEQLVRNARSGRFIKLLGISLALVFLFNVYLYAQGIINRRVDLIAWQARAALLMASSVLVVGAGLLFRDSDTQPTGLGISRPVAFYSTSLVLSSASVILLAIGGYYVRSMGGHWGIYIFTLMLFFSLIALSALFLSNSVRSVLQVWISKHFFRHKYDYRREWLSVIRALSNEPSSDHVYETVYQVIATTFQSTGGEVWIRQGMQYRKVYSRTGQPTVMADLVPSDHPFITVMQDHEWIFAPQAEGGPLADHNHTIPEWVRSHQDVQLILPLIAQSQLVGFALLEKEGLDADLTWEDLDILKTVGRQLANHILIHQQEQQLSEARQLDTYNKLSAFIMHDLNNLVAQLDLVVKNSARHKQNPAFIDDMILTVTNAVNRMKILMQKFGRSDHDAPTRFSVFEAVQASIDACKGNVPPARLALNGQDQDIQADRERFILAIKHLIKNAQEATSETGTVDVSVSTQPDGGLMISIDDTGTGMSQEFIEHQLFKPFETTKTGQGIGIGVYLTRSYLEELGANLEVDSAPGYGTCMTIRFETDHQSDFATSERMTVTD